MKYPPGYLKVWSSWLGGRPIHPSILDPKASWNWVLALPPTRPSFCPLSLEVIAGQPKDANSCPVIWIHKFEMIIFYFSMFFQDYWYYKFYNLLSNNVFSWGQSHKGEEKRLGLPPILFGCFSELRGKESNRIWRSTLTPQTPSLTPQTPSPPPPSLFRGRGLLICPFPFTLNNILKFKWWQIYIYQYCLNKPLSHVLFYCQFI